MVTNRGWMPSEAWAARSAIAALQARSAWRSGLPGGGLVPGDAGIDVMTDVGVEPLGHRVHQRRGEELVAAVLAEEPVDQCQVDSSVGFPDRPRDDLFEVYGQ